MPRFLYVVPIDVDTRVEGIRAGLESTGLAAKMPAGQRADLLLDLREHLLLERPEPTEERVTVRKGLLGVGRVEEVTISSGSCPMLGVDPIRDADGRVDVDVDVDATMTLQHLVHDAITPEIGGTPGRGHRAMAWGLARYARHRGWDADAEVARAEHDRTIRDFLGRDRDDD